MLKQTKAEPSNLNRVRIHFKQKGKTPQRIETPFEISVSVGEDKVKVHHVSKLGNDLTTIYEKADVKKIVIIKRLSF